MLGVMMSYISHSQVWGLQIEKQLYVGGKTNRAQVTFEREFIEVLNQLQRDFPDSEPAYSHFN
jgi:cytochrome c biogenesis protein